MATESDFDLIFAALERRQVRYLVVGGVAVVLHGYPRFTADLDLVIALDAPNVAAAMGALTALGYRPRAPVLAADFADPDKRRQWVRDKGLTVFSLWSDVHPATEVDLFVEEPFPFDEAYARRVSVSLGTCGISVASIADVIALKRNAGRPKDAEDIQKLTEIMERGVRHG